MFFGLPDDAVALREGLRDLLAATCTPATIRAAWDGDRCDDLWKELGSFGVLGLLVEESRGGLGLDELSYVAAMEEAGYAGVPGPLVETVAALPALSLPVDGSARIAVQRDPDENVTTYARVSTHSLKLDRERMSLVTLSGLDLDAVDTVDASRQAAKLPSHQAQGVDGSAEAVDLITLRATLGTAAFLCGLARRQVDITVDYLKTRKQFGVAIGSYQGLKHPLAEVVVGLEFAWPVVVHAAHTMAGRDISHAKAAASDAAYRVSRVCLQAHGAIGYTVEYDLHLFMKRTWALAKDWGTADQHRARIAEEIL
jgi:alkylation response protein AidB-like acyl-CoA dehydrogenase